MELSCRGEGVEWWSDGRGLECVAGDRRYGEVGYGGDECCFVSTWNTDVMSGDILDGMVIWDGTEMSKIISCIINNIIE